MIGDSKYRQGDNEVRTNKDLEGNPHSFIYFEQVAIDLCNEFDKKINVLDVGCGTGRYFCTFRNVNLLVGLDKCSNRLHEAKNPHSINIIKANVDKTVLIKSDGSYPLFKKESFDLIWSISLIMKKWDKIGNQGILNWINWLKPKGILYFIWTTNDSLNKIQKDFKLLITKNCKYEISRRKAPVRKLGGHYHFTIFKGIKEG